MKCPVCGCELNENNHFRCGRFPVCHYALPSQSDNIFNPQKNTYIVFDLETTGTNRKTDRIIEIGAVKVVDGKEVDTFDTFVNPGRYENGVKVSIPFNIVKLTGISYDMVENAPTEKEALRMFFEWCGDIKDVVGHNIALFDIPFLKASCKRNGVSFPFKRKVDTLSFVRKLQLQKMGYIENNKQTTLASYVGVKYDAHRANEDTSALYKILIALAKKHDTLPLIDKI